MSGKIGVVHRDLMSKGGGEAVAMAVLEALQGEYDLELFTLAEPDFEELNRYYDRSLDPVPVRRAGTLGPALLNRFGLKYYVLQNALLGRYARRHADDVDLLFSTINELGLEADSVQYVHFPFDWTVSLDNRDQIFHPMVEEDSLYERLCTRVAGVDPADIRSNTLLANSGWTADVVADAYGVEPDVVYPPVDTTPFDPLPWDEREAGFVTVGRIERSKRIHELIEIVDGVRDRGHDVHLHVIGPTVDEEYRRELDRLARDRPHVELEGEIPRSELIERICSHRYGIHGKEYEHFGMAVAELAAGGTIPFVPDAGGQRAVVEDREALTYASVQDAIETIDGVLSAPETHDDLQFDRDEIRRRFGRRRFEERIRAVVSEALGRTPPGRTRVPVDQSSPVPSGNGD